MEPVIVIAIFGTALLAIWLQGVEGFVCSQCIHVDVGGKTTIGKKACQNSGIDVSECTASTVAGMGYSSLNTTDQDLIARGISLRDIKHGCMKIVANGMNGKGTKFTKTVRACLKLTDVEMDGGCSEKRKSQWLNETTAESGIVSAWAKIVLDFIDYPDVLTPPETRADTKISACNCNSERCNGAPSYLLSPSSSSFFHVLITSLCLLLFLHVK